jgi:hypothetical protein
MNQVTVSVIEVLKQFRNEPGHEITALHCALFCVGLSQCGTPTDGQIGSPLH